MKKYVLLTVFVVLLANVVLPRTSSRVDASADEYAVYSAAIAHILNSETVKRIVIRDLTDIDHAARLPSKQDEKYFKNLLPALKEEVVRDYKHKNEEPLRIKNSLELNIKYVLVDETVIDIKLIGNAWWDEFYKKYPDSAGFIILSRPGFNAAMDQGLVFIHHGCGPLCGHGSYVLLEKRVDGWKVVGLQSVYVALWLPINVDVLDQIVVKRCQRSV